MGKTTGVAGGAKEKQAQDDSSNSNIDKEKEHRNEERINETERGEILCPFIVQHRIIFLWGSFTTFKPHTFATNCI